MINLSKGQSINLSKESNGLRKVTVGLGWTGRGGRDVDLDSYIGVRDANGAATKFVYFGNRNEPGIYHHGDDLVGGGRANDPNEKIDVTLNDLDGSDVHLIVGLFIYSGASNLNGVQDAFINVVDQDGKELVRYNINDFGGSKSLVAGELRRIGAEWSFTALGQGTNDGYNSTARMFRRGASASGSTSTDSQPRRRGLISRLFG